MVIKKNEKSVSPVVFKNKKVLIVGLGMSNIAVIKYLAGKGLALLTVTDLKSKNELKESVKKVQEFFPNAHFVLGEHNINDFLCADIVIRSPSILPNTRFIEKAIDAGVNVETDMSLFFKLAPTIKSMAFRERKTYKVLERSQLAGGAKGPYIIGITGTKGKTTTATFLAKVIVEQGFHTILAGNMGIPIMAKLEMVRPETWVVIELSSFMCGSLKRHKLSPKIAVYTNLFHDHLDKYKTFEEYKSDKKALFLNQNKTDIVLINKNDKGLQDFVQGIQSKILFFGAKDIPAHVVLKVKGPHYRNNIAAAFVLAKELNWNMNKVIASAESFIGLEHRMEQLDIINGIEFINNSAATNPGAFLADIQMIAQQKKSIFLLTGGSDKNLDFNKMADFINNTGLIKGAVLFKGSGTDRLREYLDPIKIICVCNNMPEAFAEIVKSVVRGSVVILNPGCASFGMFKNEFDRGEQFKKQVEKLKHKHK